MKRKRARQDHVRKRKDWCSAADAARSAFSHIEWQSHLEVKLTRIDEVFAALRSDSKVALPSQRRARGRTCFCFTCESCIPYNSLASYENRLSKAVSDGREHLRLQRQNERKTQKSMKVYGARLEEQREDLGSFQKKQKTFYDRKVSALQSRRQDKRKGKKRLKVYEDKDQREEQRRAVRSSKKRRKIFDDRDVSDQRLQKRNGQKTNKTAEVYIDNDLMEEPKPDVCRPRRSRKIFDDRSVSPEPNAYLLENIGEKASRSLKCRKCAAVFHTYNSLTYHERLHAQQFPFACSVCSQAFCLPLELKEHMDGHIRTIASTRHTVPVFRKSPSAPTKAVACGTDYSCKICLKIFRSYQTYEKHCFGTPQERQNHTLYQCFLCESCRYSFRTVEQWRKHMVSEHSILGGLRHKCVYKWLLLCQSCDKMFENFCLLRTHFFSVHSGKGSCIKKIKPQLAANVGHDWNATGEFLTEIGQNEGQAFEKTVKGNASSEIEGTLHVEVNGTHNQPQPGAGRWLRVVVSTESTSSSQPPETRISIDSTSQHPVIGNDIDSTSQLPVIGNGIDSASQHPVIGNGIDSASQHPVIGNGIDSTSQPPDIGISTPAPAVLENYSKKAQFIINSGCSYYRCEVHQLKSPSDHSSKSKSDIPSSVHEAHKNKNVISAPALLQMINQVQEKSGSVEVHELKSSSDHSSKPKSDMPSSRYETLKKKNVTSAPALLQLVKEKNGIIEREWKMIGDNHFGMNNNNDSLKCPDILKLKVLQIQYEKSCTQETEKLELDQLTAASATETASSDQRQVHQTCTADDVQIGNWSLNSSSLSLHEDDSMAADEKEQSNSDIDTNTNLVQNDLQLKTERPGPADYVYPTEEKIAQVKDSKTAVPVKSSIHSIHPVFGCRMCHRAFHTLSELKDHIPKFTAACSGALASSIELLMKDLELKLGKKPGQLTLLDYVRQGVMLAGQKVTTMSASNFANLPEPESTPSLTFTCEECKFGFPSWPEFMKHMDYSPQNRPAICQDLAFAHGQMSGTSSAAKKESVDEPELSCSCSCFCDDAAHSSPAVDRQSSVGKDVRRSVGKTNRRSSNKALARSPVSSKQRQKTQRQKTQRQKKQQKKGDRDNCPVPLYLVCNDMAKVEEFDFEYENTTVIKTEPSSAKSASDNQECSSHAYSRNLTPSPSDSQYVSHCFSSSDKEMSNSSKSCNYPAFSPNRGSSTSALQNSFEDDDDKEEEQKPDIESLKLTEISFDSDKDTSAVDTMESHPFCETVSAGEMSNATSYCVPGGGQNHSAPYVVSINSAVEDQVMTSDSESDSLIMMSSSENDSLWAVYINEDA